MKFFVLFIFIFVTCVTASALDWYPGWGDPVEISYSTLYYTEGTRSLQLDVTYGIGETYIYSTFPEESPDSIKIDVYTEDSDVYFSIMTDSILLGQKLLFPVGWNTDLIFTSDSAFTELGLHFSGYASNTTFYIDNIRFHENGSWFVWEGFEATGVKSNDSVIKTIRSYPNPVNPVHVKWIGEFWLPPAGKAILNIYDIRGRIIKSLPVSDDNGHYKVIWDGRDSNDIQVSSGSYLYRLTTENLTLEGKIVIIK